GTRSASDRRKKLSSTSGTPTPEAYALPPSSLPPRLRRRNQSAPATVPSAEATSEVFGRFVSGSTLGTAALAFCFATRFPTLSTTQPTTALRLFTIPIAEGPSPHRPGTNPAASAARAHGVRRVDRTHRMRRAGGVRRMGGMRRVVDARLARRCVLRAETDVPVSARGREDGVDDRRRRGRAGRLRRSVPPRQRHPVHEPRVRR